jgi:hypothetical protein
VFGDVVLGRHYAGIVEWRMEQMRKVSISVLAILSRGI